MKIYLVIVAVFVSLVNLSAQKPGLQQKVDAIYNEAKGEAQAGNYEKAKELLSRILKMDPGYYMANFALADIYHGSGKLDLEIEELKNGLKLSGNNFPQGFKYLAQAQFSNGQYTEAHANIEEYAILKKSFDLEEERLMEFCRFAAEAIKNPVQFNPENAGESINTSGDEYWPCLDAEGNVLVFTRLLISDNNGQKLPQPQEDLYLSKMDSGKWSKSTPLEPSVNTDANEGAQCISADGRLLFFTSCGRPDGKGSCDIYMSVRKAGKWSPAVNLGSFVNTNYWETQPSVSADGKYLFFTSNRNGGKGKMDIWRAEKMGTTSEGFPVYGKVVNQEDINTPGNELSPFIHADGQTLYFSSDYWPGMEGNDIFYSKIEDDKLSLPRNLGYPINTNGNEEGLIVEVSGGNAWFTSNTQGFGGRDIFKFQLHEKARPSSVSYVKGKVTDNKTGNRLFPSIKLYDLTTNKDIQHIYPSENEGDFLLCLPLGKNYGLIVEKEGYLFKSVNFDLEQSYSKADPLYLSIGLDPIEPGSVTVLNNIFFETDSLL